MRNKYKINSTTDIYGSWINYKQNGIALADNNGDTFMIT